MNFFRSLQILSALLAFTLAQPADAATKKSAPTPQKKASPPRAARVEKPEPVEPFSASADGSPPAISAASAIVLDADTGQVLHQVNADEERQVASTQKLLTALIIAESGNFAINFLAEDQHSIARLFSKSKLDADVRFGEGSWLSLVTGSPILDGAVASFDCEVEERIVSGTHHIYVGRVVAVASTGQDALLYRDGLFRKLASYD